MSNLQTAVLACILLLVLVFFKVRDIESALFDIEEEGDDE